MISPQKTERVAKAGLGKAAGWASRFGWLLLVAQPLIFYRRVLFNPRMHIPYDIAAFHLPLAAYVARCVREGVFPFWDPYPYCGVPIHADLTAQLFYPITWISLLLGNLSGGRNLFYWIEWLDPLHMILAGLFTFLLLRAMGFATAVAVFGGTAYQLGGFFASQAEHLGAICSGAWLPLVLLCVWKLSSTITLRWIAVLAAATALSILSGFPATSMVVLGSAGLLAIALMVLRRANWKLLAALAGGLALGHGIAVVQLVPTLLLTGRSVASTRAQIDGTGGGLAYQSLVSLVAPNHYHIFTPSGADRFQLPIDYTFLYVYCGILPLALVLAAPFLKRAPYARMLFILTLITAVWMLGDRTPIYRLVYTHLPRLVRGSLYAGFALLAFSMFAALAAAAALERARAWAPAWLLWAVALVTAADLTLVGANRPMNAQEGSYRRWENENQFFDNSDGLRRIQRLIGSTSPPVRVDYLQTDVFLAATGAELLKLPTADGDNPFALRRIIALRWLFAGGNFWERQLPVNRPSSPLLGMLNIGYLAGIDGSPQQPSELTRLEAVAQVSNVRWYRNPAVLPRFLLVPHLHFSSDEKDALAYLARPDFRPAEEAVVETNDFRATEPLGEGQVRVDRYSANQVELTVTATKRAFLVSSEVLYPGWTATVNGKPAPLYMTNGAFRGLRLNQGTNQIMMSYWPENFTAWAAISILCALLAGGGAIFGGSHWVRQNHAL